MGIDYLFIKMKMISAITAALMVASTAATAI